MVQMHCGLFFLPLLSLIFGIYGDGEDFPKFSPYYSVKGVLYIPYAELREPFSAWFDGTVGSSRIDYYGDMAQTYQLTREGQFGSSLKVVPITTEQETNVKTCLQANGTLLNKIMPQSVLPDLTGFKYIGNQIIDGQQTEKWRMIDVKGEKVNKYTMYLQLKKSPKNPNLQIPVPVRYEMKGYNSLLGSHYDHYYLVYQEFSWEQPIPSVFEIKKGLTCQGFPGPGSYLIATFNPMKEFINHDFHHIDTAWEEFLHKHNKSYDDNSEHFSRKNIFTQNVRLIHSTNRANKGYQLAINHLADRTEDELKALRGRRYSEGYNGGQPFPYNAQEAVKSAPEQWDWRIYGAVTPVKDQSVCGSCWSFGTTGAVEGAYFVKYQNLVRLSQQALVDCSWGFGNNGCDGGEDFRSYQWMMKHGGLPTEDSYGPYYGQDGYCHIDKVPLTAKITGYVNVTSGDPDALKVALLKHGPISVAIDASHKTFSFYSNGIYNEPNCSNTVDGLDHAVLLVGYGEINKRSYWLIKNSWSNYWGNDGYVLMDPVNNNCGVMTTPTYVTM